MTILPLYAAPERLQPWIAAGLWLIIAAMGAAVWVLVG